MEVLAAGRPGVDAKMASRLAMGQKSRPRKGYVGGALFCPPAIFSPRKAHGRTRSWGVTRQLDLLRPSEPTSSSQLQDWGRLQPGTTCPASMSVGPWRLCQKATAEIFAMLAAVR
jgi:hypothetical protein